MPRRSALRITKRTVDALRVADKDTLFWDRDLAAFGVRVHATGRKVYVVQTRGPAGPKRVTLGLHGDLSAGEARKQAAVVIDRIRRGEAPVPMPPEPELTVAVLTERFMRMHVEQHCKPRTVTTYRSVLDGHILPALGAKAVSAVGPKDITALHRALGDTPGTANSAVRVVSAMFGRAEAWELIAPGRNPCRSVRPYKLRSCERFLTPDEYRRLGQAMREAQADGSVPSAVVAAILLLMLTGCRKSEILTLRWKHVVLEAGELRIPDSKTGARVVPLSPAAVKVLAALPRPPGNPWVIPGRRPDTHLRALADAWKVIRARAGLKGVRIHDLRHTFASRALALGESLPMIGKLLGHSQMETASRYAHLARDSVHESAARITEREPRHRHSGQ